uniref:Uncharacterized protein n=1 Tax=Myotis myotis TaxID=51298 RepID=A0A7J7RMP2_MYOMY|nr:hypothetical protein mMyoMyo1_010242 [Myotis myotis]
MWESESRVGSALPHAAAAEPVLPASPRQGAQGCLPRSPVRNRCEEGLLRASRDSVAPSPRQAECLAPGRGRRLLASGFLGGAAVQIHRVLPLVLACPSLLHPPVCPSNQEQAPLGPQARGTRRHLVQASRPAAQQPIQMLMLPWTGSRALRSLLPGAQGTI